MGSALDRYNLYVVRKDGCWSWTGSKTTHGYAMFQSNNQRIMAHRFAYMIENGPIPDSMVIMHTCDNPECSNPAHLRLGTHADNMRDMSSKGRAGRGGQRGVKHHASKFTEQQIIDIRLSGEANKALANKFNVSKQCIHYIRTKGWKTIESEVVPYPKARLGCAGATNPNARLTEDHVREIRASNDVKTSVLAQRYGVTQDSIRQIIRRVSWKHV